jgi:predicted transcriptional regulator
VFEIPRIMILNIDLFEASALVLERMIANVLVAFSPNAPQRRILEALRNGPLKAGRLAEISEVDSSEMHKQLKALLRRGIVIKAPRVGYLLTHVPVPGLEKLPDES